MNPRPPDPELRRLVDRLHDGPPPSKPEIARLEELLEDDEALAYYVAVTQQEAFLPELLAETPVASAPVRRRMRIPWVPVSLAAAAGIAFMLGLYVGRRGAAPATVAAHAEPAVPSDSPPARITGLVGVEWNDGEEPDLLGRGAAADHLVFKTGLVELTYANGVRLTLEGPADYRINDAVSGRLDFGKLYATVPKGAEGFRVDYSRGSVVDLGTEFAMEARPDGTTELGVFKGEIELRRPGADPLSLFENQSLVHGLDSQYPIHAVPLDRKKFVRDLPNRDFRWEVRSFESEEIVFDVTHLVWKPSEYRAIFKWVAGKDGIKIRNVRLCLDGKPVATDAHLGRTGNLPQVRDNIYALDIDPNQFHRGRWTLHATVELLERTRGLAPYKGPARSQGILQFEEGLVSRSSAEDFVGRWSYRVLGARFVREFHPDGTVTLEKNGRPCPASFRGSRWTITNGVLHATVPERGTIEAHVLRNRNTLIFVSQPFENAKRINPLAAANSE
jgi:hypothetical protein